MTRETTRCFFWFTTGCTSTQFYWPKPKLMGVIIYALVGDMVDCTCCLWYDWVRLFLILLTAFVVDDMVDCFCCGWYGWLYFSMICLTCFGFCFVGYAAEQVTCDRHDIHAVLLNVTLNTKTKSSNICPDLPPRESRYPINAVCFSDVSMVTREPASILQ